MGQYEQIRDLLNRGILNEGDFSLNYYNDDIVQKKQATRISEMYEDLSKEDMARQIERLLGQLDVLRDKNSQHIDKVSECKEIIDSLSKKLRKSEEELKKITFAFRNSSFEGLRESIYDIYCDNTDEAKATIVKCENFMNFGTPQTLKEIPNQYHLQEAILKLRYEYVIKNLPTSIKTYVS